MANDPDTSSSWTRRYSSCVANINLCVVMLFLLLMCVISIAWLVMNPHEPSIRVGSLSVSHFSVSDSQLRGTYDIVFNMSNPNKKIDMFLDQLIVSIRHHEVELARGTVLEKEAISLERTPEMKVKVHMVMKADAANLGKKEKKVFAEVGEEWRRRVVNFNVRIEVTVRFEAGNWPPKSQLLNLNCGKVAVVFFSDHKGAGKLVGIGGKDDCHL